MRTARAKPDVVIQLNFNKQIEQSTPRKQSLAGKLPVQSLVATFGRLLAGTRRFLCSFLRYPTAFLL